MITFRLTRPVFTILLLVGLFLCWQIIFLSTESTSIHDLDYVEEKNANTGGLSSLFSSSSQKSLSSTATSPRKPRVPIMSEMGNATLRAELGRSAWRLLHTMAGKFPESPTKPQQQSLLDFIYLFAELYPCGDCAAHFKIILESNPPDVSSREAISQWACKVHNIVNKRLEKPQFDCSKVGDFWKCGCAEEDKANVTRVSL